MIKFRWRLATWLFMGTEMADGNKKLSIDALYLVESNDRGIATDFYNTRWGYSERIGFGPNS